MNEDSEARASAGANEDDWLTTGEAARILGASLPTVRRMADNGTLTTKRAKAWTSTGADRHGRPLRGHRRVSRESVMRVKAERELAEREATTVRLHGELPPESAS